MKTKVLVEGGLCVALTYLLGWIVFWKMPQGGSIHAAHMVPIFFFALRRGPKAGILAGIAYGVLEFLIGEKYSLHPLSILLDYIVPGGALGLIGYAKPGRWNAVWMGFLACVCRFISYTVSGAVVFGSYAPEGMNPWWYSLVYNLTVHPADTILSLAVLAVLYPKIMSMRR